MNKAFELILERLEEKTIPVLDEDEHIIPESNIREPYEIEMVALSDVKQIVQEVAEEYNGCWIPCSVRLPEEYTVLCCDNYGEMIVGHPYFDDVSNTNYSAESDNEMMYNCVAWQHLPEQYKQKGE